MIELKGIPITGEAKNDIDISSGLDGYGPDARRK
jgi:hypothetical protein